LNVPPRVAVEALAGVGPGVTVPTTGSGLSVSSTGTSRPVAFLMNPIDTFSLFLPLLLNLDDYVPIFPALNLWRNLCMSSWWR
jgi:hypothetical protein